MFNTCVLSVYSRSISTLDIHGLYTSFSLRFNVGVQVPLLTQSYTNNYRSFVHINYSLIQSVTVLLSTVSTYLTITVTKLKFNEIINNNTRRLSI